MKVEDFNNVLIFKHNEEGIEKMDKFCDHMFAVCPPTVMSKDDPNSHFVNGYPVNDGDMVIDFGGGKFGVVAKDYVEKVLDDYEDYLVRRKP